MYEDKMREMDKVRKKLASTEHEKEQEELQRKKQEIRNDLKRLFSQSTTYDKKELIESLENDIKSVEESEFENSYRLFVSIQWAKSRLLRDENIDGTEPIIEKSERAESELYKHIF